MDGKTRNDQHEKTLAFANYRNEHTNAKEKEKKEKRKPFHRMIIMVHKYLFK